MCICTKTKRQTFRFESDGHFFFLQICQTCDNVDIGYDRGRNWREGPLKQGAVEVDAVQESTEAGLALSPEKLRVRSKFLETWLWIESVTE